MLDYDDLLLYFAQILVEPAIAAEIASRFDHLLVDEYQDTNTLQAEIALGFEAPRALVLPSSATTRSRSIRFARRPCATSWIFQRSSIRRHAW